MTSYWEQVIAEARLISLPEAYLQLKEVLDDPDYSMAEVAVPISQDPALTARLLRLVNSSFYGFAGNIDTVFRAVTMIGSQQVYNLALATAVAQTFDSMDNRIMDMTEFWRHSVFCGLAAKNLAKACNVLDSERLFVAGLLHDIGHLIMYQSIPELSQQAILKAQKTGQALHLVEKELTGLNYTRVGGELMRQWQLPGSLRETTEFHLEPEKALSYPLETHLVHIAVIMARAEKVAIEANNASLEIHQTSLEAAGLSMDTCVKISQETEQNVMTVLASMFPLKNTA